MDDVERPFGAETTPGLSVVVPFYNEEGNLELLVDEVARALASLDRPFELVLVDDGSTDGSFDEAVRTRARHPFVRVVQLAVNSGQSEALLVGLRAARAPVVATLDADLQNDPADIPRLLEHLRTCDMVCGWRARRQDSWLRLASSRIANAVRRAIQPDPVRDTGCSLKVFRAECLAGAPFFRGAHRFLATLAQMGGFRVDELEVNHRPRHAGVAKYGVWNRVFRSFADLLGVRWLWSRRIRARVAKEVPPSSPPSPSGSR